MMTERYSRSKGAIRSVAFRWLAHVLFLLLAVAVLWSAVRLIARPDPQDQIRRGDALFAAGRFHDARAVYGQVAAHAPPSARLLARQGMVAAVRGDDGVASRWLGGAIGMGLAGNERAVARLYQAHVALAQGYPEQAQQFWLAVPADSPLLPVRLVLQAEQALHAGDAAAAEALFRSIHADTLPAEWRALLHNRLVVVQAARAPAAAVALLPMPPDGSPDGIVPPALATLIAPLLPVDGPDTATLAAALRAPADQQAQLLGQAYLAGTLYTLAEAQFAHAASAGQRERAAAYGAYTRWQAGDRAGGQQQLAALVAANPQEPSARTLLALIYLADRNAPAAQSQLDAVRALAPAAPDTHLAWAQWYAAESDYLAAAAEYRRAVADAPLDQRGVYTLAQARFHLETDVAPCDAGRSAAEETVRLLPNNAAAWSTLAAARFRCDDAVGAQTAAAQGLVRDPASAEAAYYLGRALAAQGNRAAARDALVRAADLAPASPWRTRAEAQLALMGL